MFDGVLDSREAMPPRQSSSSSASGLTLCVSQMHLNYESMQDELRETQELLNDFNAQIQTFMVVRNKNTFIAFLTFSDIYVCFTLFVLQVMVQRIPDAAGIPMLLGSHHHRGVGRSRNGHHGHRQDHQRLKLGTILLKPSQIKSNVAKFN
jgi:hypothetical protein